MMQPEGENEALEDVTDRCLHLVITQGMHVLVTKKKINGNVKTIHLLDARRQYWLSKAQQATFLRVHTITRPELSLGTNMTQHLVDHLDKKDISFDHMMVVIIQVQLLSYFTIKISSLLCPLILQEKGNLEKR